MIGLRQLMNSCVLLLYHHEKFNISEFGISPRTHIFKALTMIFITYLRTAQTRTLLIQSHT
uniref:Uncharacterized protein n=1 Tax=Rhizophora mucronata TaxID=61149 RepID=A0A2P2NJY4_RHIMU